MASLPSLVVNLALDSAQFIDGLTKGEYQAKKSAEAIKASIENIGHTITTVAGLVGVGFGVHAFEEMIKGSLDAEVALQHLGARAGLTGSQLSSLIEPARLAHTDLETVAQASTKLSKALLDFGNDGAKSTQVLKALGLSAAEVPALLARPQDALLKMAHLLDTLPEGGTKAGAQLLILGRAGGATAAVMEELAKKTELVARRTQEEIDAAVELDHRFVQLDLRTSGLKTTFANALVEPINGILDAFAKLTTGTNDVKSMLLQLRNDGSIQEWARQGAIAIATLVESLLLVGRTAIAISGSFRVVAADIEVLNAKANAPSQKITGAFGFSPEEAAAGEAEYQRAVERRAQVLKSADQGYIDLISKDATAITKALRESFAAQDAATKNVPTITFSDIQAGSAEVAEKAAARIAAAQRVQTALNQGNQKGDPARAKLEGDIKAQERLIALQRDLLNTQENFLKAYYDNDLITIEGYFDSLQAARETALQQTIAAYDAEITAARVYIATKAKTEAEKEKARNTISEAEDKQKKAIVDSVNLEKLQSLERTKNLRKYADELEGIRAQLLAVQGNTAAAAAIQFDIANRHNVAQATLNNDGATLQRVAALREQAVLQAGLNDVTKIYDTLLGSIAVQQGYINLAQSTGRISEIEALQKQSDLNKAMLPYLDAIAKSYQRIAEESGLAQDILKAQQMQLAVEQLRTQTDLLADSFNKTFGDAFGNAISDLATGAKTVKEAFNDMVKSITKSISDIAGKTIASKLFGQEGPLAGIGETFSKIFGGGSNAKGVDTGAAASAAQKAADAATQTLTSATTLGTSGIALQTAGFSLETAGISLDGAGITLDTAGVALNTAGITMETAGVSHTTAAAALTAAAELLSAAATTSGSSSAASGIGGIFGKLFESGGADSFSGFGSGPYSFAGGTDFAPGGLAMVGEHGPEIVNLPRGSQVFPSGTNPGGKGQRPHLTVVVNVPQGTSGASADQIGIRVGAHVERAVRRNG